MAASFPSMNRMDAWPQNRSLQTMNLRSVFTPEQQRILEQYYENGMTNQSKACFQLILQCAQQAKLDFSVVRTWVGNKRRKLASKGEQDGGISHTLSSHGLSASGLLSSRAIAGGTLSNHSLVAGALLPAEIAASCNIQNRVHLLPPASSFPSFSSTSSQSASSPIVNGSTSGSSTATTTNPTLNNNNDVILTGIYSLNSVPRSRLRPAAPPPQQDSAHTSSSVVSHQALQSRSTSTSSTLQSKLIPHPQSIPSHTSGPIVHTAARKGVPSLGDAGITVGAGMIPHSWVRQFAMEQTHSGSSSSSHAQLQPQPRPHSNPQPQPPASEKTWLPLPVQNSGPTYDHQTPRIQQVFTLSEKGEADKAKPNLGLLTEKGQQTGRRPVPHFLESSHNLSIAMETGNAEDEWQREEELANMAVQAHINREQKMGSLTVADREGHNPPTISSKPMTLQGSYTLTAQTSLTGESSSQTSVYMSGSPWIISSSRKRTLQDRTQFSDGDLIQLKRYWDRGMTSLGSVCREKITAAANQLSVDTEIVKTWISNRRRKYRLMGIDIPPPKGGPVLFCASSPGDRSPGGLSPAEERLRTPELRDDLDGTGSISLSEDGTVDSQLRDREDGDIPAAPLLANNVKTEVIDDDEEDDDYNVELMATDLEQMQSLLEFKHEEVQFLENELENQKQKYRELASYTKSLLSAVRNHDLVRQQELVASLPQPSDLDWEEKVEAKPGVDLGEASHSDSLMPTAHTLGDEDVFRKKEERTSEETQPSASEELLQEPIPEQE